jgi:hypothetical protein
MTALARAGGFATRCVSFFEGTHGGLFCSRRALPLELAVITSLRAAIEATRGA